MLAQHIRTILLGLAAITFTSACSHVNVPVQVTRPAEINLASYKKIAVGPFQGLHDAPSNVFEVLVTAVQALADANSGTQAFQSNWQGQRDDGSDVALYIFNSLNQTGRFAMIDFSIIPTARASGDAVLMVSGTVARRDWNTNVSSTKNKNSDGGVYYTYTRSTQVNYSVNLNLVDVSTGNIYLTRQYPCYRSENRSQNGSKPAKPGNNYISNLYDACKREIASKFAKAVAPYTETVYAAFAKIDNSPETEAGINQARVGNWTSAIASFQSVPATLSMAEAGIQAKAWWNLGLAYQYNHEFAKATEMVQKALALDPDSRYSRELANIGLLQQNQERLKAQEYKGDVPPGS